MTRTIARQIAVRICISEDFLNDTPDSIINDFFDEEHYKSLKEDDEIFRSIPGEREMDYIRKLITKVYEHSAEIDSMISSFSEKRIKKSFAHCSTSQSSTITSILRESLLT